MSPILVPTLAELRVELDRLQTKSAQAWTSIRGEFGSIEHDASCDRAVAASAAVDDTVEAIAALPAASLADLRVKAYALDFLDRTCEPFEYVATTDLTLIRQLIAGLLDERIA